MSFMSVDTKGKLKGHVSEEEVLNFIKHRFDTDATMEIKKDDYGDIKNKKYIKKCYDNSQTEILYYGFISFTYKGEKRQLFYSYSNCNCYYNLELYSRIGLEDMVKSETTDISLGCWGNSDEIVKSIVTHFGGWYDYNDCDDIEFEPIFKDENDNIKPVIHVTMDDIYEKFGGVVIIDK